MSVSRYVKLLPLVVLLVAVAAFSFGGLSFAQAQPQLTSVYQSGPLPLTDPLAAVWDTVTGLTVPLIPQAGVAPALSQVSIAQVEVKSLNDGQWITFLLSWDDPTQNLAATQPDQFRDAAAIQSALDEALPNLCMGAIGQQVNLWHWKADWQTDIDQGFQDVVDAYPNFWNDYYPFAVGTPPYRVPADFSSADARTYLVGWAVGNPLSDPNRVTPVEDLSAIGFGTVTHQTQQDALGRGVWQDGRWRVVFSRPLTSADANDMQFRPGQANSLAFAVWDGENQEVGARKQLSSWVVMDVQGAPQPTPVQVVATAVPVPAATPTLAPTPRPTAPPQEGTRPGDMVGAIVLAVFLTAAITLLVTRGMGRT